VLLAFTSFPPRAQAKRSLHSCLTAPDGFHRRGGRDVLPKRPAWRKNRRGEFILLTPPAAP